MTRPTKIDRIKVFVGSSSQADQDLVELRRLIQIVGMAPQWWKEPDTFRLGRETWSMLVQKTSEVDAALFVFREDDEVTSKGEKFWAPRDNVILEYGLFSGVLGPQRCAIVMKGNPRLPSDLASVTLVDLNNLVNAKRKLRSWAHELRGRLKSKPDLSIDQIAAMSRALLRTGVARDRVASFLGLPAALVEHALLPTRRKTQRRVG